MKLLGVTGVLVALAAVAACGDLRNASTDPDPRADGGVDTVIVVRDDAGGTFLTPEGGLGDASADPSPPPTCDGGLCPAESFATTEQSVDLVLTATEVFMSGADIQRCSKTDCSAPQTVIKNANAKEPLVAGSTVFWVSYFNDAIESCPVTGCTTPTPLVHDATNLYGLVSDGVNLYWTTDTGVYTCAIEDCSNTAIALFSGEPNNNQRAAIANGLYFWTNGQGQVLSCPLSGICTPAALATTPEGAALVSTDGTNVFWVAHDRVAMCAASGCNHAPTFFPGSEPTFSLSDGKNLFFEDSVRYIARCPLTGCPPQGIEVIFDERENSNELLPSLPLAVDDDYIYFSELTGVSRLKKH